MITETNLKFKEKIGNRTMTKKIVVHHSNSGPVDARTIHQWHLNKDYAGIGYQYVIKVDGTIERGRPELAIGAHAKGANSDGIGICLAGNFMGGATPTPAQMDSLVWLIRDIQSRFGLIPVVRHRDVTPTACPGDSFPWQELQNRLRGDDGKVPEWMSKIMADAKAKGLLMGDHDPKEPATKWFVLAVGLNILKILGR